MTALSRLASTPRGSGTRCRLADEGPVTGRIRGACSDELVSDDTDLGDLQYRLFNLLTMAWFRVAFLPHLLSADGLPELPTTLIGLTGVSTAGYVTKKALEPAAAGRTAMQPGYQTVTGLGWR